MGAIDRQWQGLTARDSGEIRESHLDADGLSEELFIAKSGSGLLCHAKKFAQDFFRVTTRRPEPPPLTETQIDILRLVSEGQTTASIAKERNVSEKSVEAALSRTYSALGLERSPGLNPRVQLTRAYFRLAGKKPPNE